MKLEALPLFSRPPARPAAPRRRPLPRAARRRRRVHAVVRPDGELSIRRVGGDGGGGARGGGGGGARRRRPAADAQGALEPALRDAALRRLLALHVEHDGRELLARRRERDERAAEAARRARARRRRRASAARRGGSARGSTRSSSPTTRPATSSWRSTRTRGETTPRARARARYSFSRRVAPRRSGREMHFSLSSRSCSSANPENRRIPPHVTRDSSSRSPLPLPPSHQALAVRAARVGGSSYPGHLLPTDPPRFSDQTGYGHLHADVRELDDIKPLDGLRWAHRAEWRVDLCRLLGDEARPVSLPPARRVDLAGAGARCDADGWMCARAPLRSPPPLGLDPRARARAPFPPPNPLALLRMRNAEALCFALARARSLASPSVFRRQVQPRHAERGERVLARGRVRQRREPVAAAGRLRAPPAVAAAARARRRARGRGGAGGGGGASGGGDDDEGAGAAQTARCSSRCGACSLSLSRG